MESAQFSSSTTRDAMRLTTPSHAEYKKERLLRYKARGHSMGSKTEDGLSGMNSEGVSSSESAEDSPLSQQQPFDRQSVGMDNYLQWLQEQNTPNNIGGVSG